MKIVYLDHLRMCDPELSDNVNPNILVTVTSAPIAIFYIYISPNR